MISTGPGSTAPRLASSRRSSTPTTSTAHRGPPSDTATPGTSAWPSSSNARPAGRCRTSPASTCSNRSGCATAGTGPARRHIRPRPRRPTPSIRRRCPSVTVASGPRPRTCCAGTRRSKATNWAISALLHTPGRLDDGTLLDYAWALDVRTHAGFRVYRHGGRWAGLSTQLVRIADQRCGFVIIALDADEDRTGRLASALIEDLVPRLRSFA